MHIPFPGLSMFIHISAVIIGMLIGFLKKIFKWQKKRRRGRKQKISSLTKSAINAFSMIIIVAIFTIVTASASFIFYMGVASPTSNARLAQVLIFEQASAKNGHDEIFVGKKYHLGTMLSLQRSFYIYK